MTIANHGRHADAIGTHPGPGPAGPSADDLLEAAITAEARKVENSAAGALAEMIRMQANGFFQPLHITSSEEK